MRTTTTWMRKSHVASRASSSIFLRRHLKTRRERINVETGHLVSVLTDSTDWIGSGTIDSEELPQATQGLIRWSTGTIAGGRRLQGHTFIPGTTENMSDNGVPSSTLLGKYQTAADLLATSPDGVRQRNRKRVGSIGSGWR